MWPAPLLRQPECAPQTSHERTQQSTPPGGGVTFKYDESHTVDDVLGKRMSTTDERGLSLTGRAGVLLPSVRQDFSNPRTYGQHVVRVTHGLPKPRSPPSRPLPSLGAKAEEPCRSCPRYGRPRRSGAFLCDACGSVLRRGRNRSRRRRPSGR